MAAEKPSRLDSIYMYPISETSANRQRIRIGSGTITWTFVNNTTATAFKARLPLTLSMNELNGNDEAARAEICGVAETFTSELLESRFDSNERFNAVWVYYAGAFL